MLRVGLTGGIGSGKSLVSEIFTSMGVPVYHADVRSKRIVNENKDLRTAISAAFGPDSFTSEGEYNRAFMASVVFNDKSKMKELNAIIHPYVFKDWEDFCESHRSERYVVKEVAILFETDSWKTVDTVVAVLANTELRIARVMKRDGLNRGQVIQRMEQQMTNDELRQKSQYVINNDGVNSLIEQVVSLNRIFTTGDPEKLKF